MHGKDDDLDLGMVLPDFRQGLDPIHDRHLDIQQYNVGVQVFEEIEQLHAVIRFRNQFHVFLNGKSCFHASPEQGMIIRNGYFDGLAGLWSFHTILVFYMSNRPSASLRGAAGSTASYKMTQNLQHLL